MRERIDTLTSDEVIALIKDVFDEDELNNFYNYVNENNDKDIENNEKSIMLNNSFYNENNIKIYEKLYNIRYT